MPISQLQLANLYVPDTSSVGNYYGTFQVAFSQAPPTLYTLTYMPGGQCTAGANDSPQSISVNYDAGTGSFSASGVSLQVGGVVYQNIDGSWNSTSNTWSGTLSGTQATTNWVTANSMVFPYAPTYILMVYEPGLRSSQVNSFGGALVLSSAPSGASFSLSLAASGQTVTASVQPVSNLLSYGNAPGPTMSFQNATYTFGQLNFAFTPLKGRAVIWGTLSISGSSNTYYFVAFSWPATGLPATNWQLKNSAGDILGVLDLVRMQFLPVNGGPGIPVSQPNPQFQFTSGNVLYSGMPQVTINVASGPLGPPTGLNWNFGGTWHSPAADDGSWTSTAQTGDIPPGLESTLGANA